MSSRGVHERQLTQNGHKTTMKMVYTGKSYTKNIQNFAILTKRTLLWAGTIKQESQARIVIYLLYNCYTFLSDSCNRMEKGSRYRG